MAIYVLFLAQARVECQKPYSKSHTIVFLISSTRKIETTGKKMKGKWQRVLHKTLLKFVV